MKPKTLIMVTLLLMALHGLGLFLGAEDAAKMGLPDIGADELNMGKGAYEIGAMFNFFLVAVLSTTSLPSSRARLLPPPQEVSSASSRHGRSTSLS